VSGRAGPGGRAVGGGVPGRGEERAPGRASTPAEADWYWLRRAIELSRRCPPSRSAFAVGAVIVAGDGSVLATGYSREGSPHDHAEEAALAKLEPADPRLGGVAGSGLASRGVAGPGLAERGVAGPGLAERGVAGPGLAERGVAGSGLAERAATLYSSLEPCAARASRPRPCAELIIAAGLRRVVIAWLEPPVFAAGGGAALLRAAGVTVVQIGDLAAEARAVNAAVLGE
jgi:diaminohydroxyphosphoribosylaminopyrimidine deaminase / 5-amino-6-(5-phosphoribosylamino)uracil reductase